MAVTAFEKWVQANMGTHLQSHQIPWMEFGRKVWNACAAEAERLCRERALAEDASIACNCADAIAKLAEVEQ